MNWEVAQKISKLYFAALHIEERRQVNDQILDNDQTLDNATQNVQILICLLNCLPRVITATMLFLQFVQYSLSFVGTPKNEIPGAVLELCRLKIKQFSPGILKFSRMHEDNPFTLNIIQFLGLVCLYFMQARVDWVLIFFGTRVIKKKRQVRPVFPDYLFVSHDYD